MLGKVLTGIKRFVLWDYDRATWQYDVMVGLILAFVLLTPRSWFNDQPRIPGASRIAMLQAHDPNGHWYWIDEELLSNVPEAQRLAKASEMLRARAGEQRPVVRLESMVDSEAEVKGYIAFTRP
jgi:hypothetical protein